MAILIIYENGNNVEPAIKRLIPYGGLCRTAHTFSENYQIIHKISGEVLSMVQ
jgi:hypothetical protein